MNTAQNAPDEMITQLLDDIEHLREEEKKARTQRHALEEELARHLAAELPREGQATIELGEGVALVARRTIARTLDTARLEELLEQLSEEERARLPLRHSTNLDVRAWKSLCEHHPALADRLRPLIEHKPRRVSFKRKLLT